MGTSDTLDVGRANLEAERARLLNLLESGAEQDLLVADFLEALGKDAEPFTEVYRQLDVATLLEIVRGDGAPALDRVASSLARIRYGMSASVAPKTSPRGKATKKSATKRKSTKATAKKKSAKKDSVKKPSKKKASETKRVAGQKKGAKKPRQVKLPNVIAPRVKVQTVAFDRQVVEAIAQRGLEGVKNGDLLDELKCSKGKLRLSLQRLKKQLCVTQTGERKLARYVVTPKGETFANPTPASTEEKETA